MNNRKLFYIELIGMFFTAIVGTLLHFAFDWSGQTTIVAFFAPVNESVWEHLKLLFIPYLIYTIVEYFLYGKNKHNFLLYKAVSVLLGLAFIPTMFYIYTSVLGESVVFIDILLFYLAVFFSYSLSYLLQRRNPENTSKKLLGTLLLFALVFLFIRFTFAPLHTSLFEDPQTKTYGIPKG